MNTASSVRRCAWLVLVGAGFAALPTRAHAQQATISGTVSDSASGRPIEQVQVSVVGTTLGGLTNAEGRYTIRGVPAGDVTVRVLRVGYREGSRRVTLTAGGTATVDFRLGTVPISLAPVVTTATGEQRRIELGNAVGNINVRDVTATAPVTNVIDVLNARTPGVVVNSGPQTGSGARVRIRGQSSLSLSNDPIYVIDGVRMTSNNNSSSFGTGASPPSRVGDLNPEEIENIEIVKGPSAATLYGTDAANGVIVITTKRGRAGTTRWSVYGESGVLTDQNDYPTAYTIAGRNPNSPAYRECVLREVALGTCLADSVRALNLFERDDLTLLGTGNRYQFGAQASGGTEQVRFFLSGEREEETGVLELPQFERQRFNENNLTIEEWTDRPNALEKNAFRANMTMAMTPKLDVTASTGYINLNQRFSLESNLTAGIGSQAYGGKGYTDPSLTVPGQGTPLNGYRLWTPGYTWQEKRSQRINRFIGAVNGNWRTTSWWQNNFNVGVDLTDRVEDDLLRRGEGPPVNATYRLGFKNNWRTDIRNVSLDVSSSAQFNPRPWLGSKTTAGVQYVNYQFDRSTSSGANLPPGTTTTGAGAEPGAAEATTLQKTLGAFLEQQFAIRDRLFVTGAVRSDQNSAFGTDFQNVIYPKASVSWVLSDESFFPELGWLDQLRLRSAYGSSGVQPGPNDALRSFQSTTINVENGDRPGVTYATIGNSELKPEKTTEFEAGFETRLFGSKATIDVTWYRKRTKDALIAAIVPPSAGAANTVRQNLGSTENTGWEALITTQLLDRSWLGIDLTLNGATYSNEVRSLGGTPPQIIGNYRQVQEGYPLFSFWAQKITSYGDRNGDGIITYYGANDTRNEIEVGANSEYIGYAQPRHTLTVTPAFELLNRRLRMTAMFDYRGGHYIWNDTERIRCGSRANCEGTSLPGADLFEQARAVALRDHPSRTLAGYIEKGDFTLLREVTATYTVPERMLTKLRAFRSASVNFSARNLAWWAKDYRGIHPDIDRVAGADDDVPDQFQTLGPASTYVLRLNLGF